MFQFLKEYTAVSQGIYCSFPRNILQFFKEYTAVSQIIYCSFPRNMLQFPKEYIELPKEYIAVSQGIYCSFPRNILQFPKEYIAVSQGIYCSFPRNKKPILAFSISLWSVCSGFLVTKSGYCIIVCLYILVFLIELIVNITLKSSRNYNMFQGHD